MSALKNRKFLFLLIVFVILSVACQRLPTLIGLRIAILAASIIFFICIWRFKKSLIDTVFNKEPAWISISHLLIAGCLERCLYPDPLNFCLTVILGVLSISLATVLLLSRKSDVFKEGGRVAAFKHIEPFAAFCSVLAIVSFVINFALALA